jgi:hypothetical protein
MTTSKTPKLHSDRSALHNITRYVLYNMLIYNLRGIKFGYCTTSCWIFQLGDDTNVNYWTSIIIHVINARHFAACIVHTRFTLFICGMTYNRTIWTTHSSILSAIHSFSQSFFHRFILSSILSFTHSFFHPFILSSIHSFIHSFFLLFILPFIHSFTYLYFHPFTISSINAFINWFFLSLFHPSIDSFIY